MRSGEERLARVLMLCLFNMTRSDIYICTGCLNEGLEKESRVFQRFCQIPGGVDLIFHHCSASVSLPNTAAAVLVRLRQAHLSGEWTGESRGQEGGVRGPRVVMVMVGAGGQRGTLSPLSPCEKDSGVSVFGLACSPPSLPRSLRPRSCFSLSLFVLAVHTATLSSKTLRCACTRRCTCIAATCTIPALFVLAVFRCHLLEPLNASNQPNTPACLHLPKRGHTHPVSLNMIYQPECVGLKHNRTFTINTGILYNTRPSVLSAETRDSVYLLLETANNTLIHKVQCLFQQCKQKRQRGTLIRKTKLIKATFQPILYLLLMKSIVKHLEILTKQANKNSYTLIGKIQKIASVQWLIG